MDEKSFKQRLVGAIVLVALAVIFIPMLLPGHGDKIFKDADDVIPAKPTELENIKILELEAEADSPEPRTSVRTPVDRHTPVESPVRDEKPQKPATDEPQKTAETKPTESEPRDTVPKSSLSSKPKAWAVQVGSFSNRNNAIRLRDKLRNKNYHAFVEKLQTDNKVVYRVRIGPEVQRDEAEKLQKDILAKMKIKGLVVSHP